MVKRESWLSVTPEPERELPWAVATLAAGDAPSPEAVARERARLERLILRGRQRQWLAYLHGVVELTERAGVGSGPEVARARSLAREVIANHHNLLIALPGPGAGLTEGDRMRLHESIAPRGGR
jgi:hypothetical protein